MKIHENTIKLQLGYYISVVSLRCMMDALRALDLDTLTDEGQSTLNEIEFATMYSQTVLDNILGEIRETDDNIDSQDEKGIEDMACKVEKMIEAGLYKKKIPTPKDVTTHIFQTIDAIADNFQPEKLKKGKIKMEDVSKMAGL